MRQAGTSVILWVAIGASVLLVAVLALIAPPGKPLPAPPAPPATEVASAPPTPTAATPSPAPTAAPSPTTAPPAASPAAEVPDSVTLFASVRTSEGESVAGGSFYVIPRTDARVADQVARAFTKPELHALHPADAAGEARITIPAGKAFLVGLMIAGEPQGIVQEVDPAEKGTELEAEFTLPAPIDFRGTVSDERQARIPGVAVVARWVPTTLAARTPAVREERTTTDAEGRFAFKVPSPETVTFLIDEAALAAPYLVTQEPLVLARASFAEARAQRVDLAVVRGRDLQGRVVAEEGERPIANATVTLTELASLTPGREPRSLQTTTDDEGLFRFERLAPAERHLVAEHPSYNRTFVEAVEPPDDDSELLIILTPQASLQGAVRLPAGGEAVTAQGTALLLEREGEKRLPLGPGSLVRPLHFDRLAPGPAVLLVECTTPTQVWYLERRVTIPDGAPLDLGTLEPEPLREAPGRLLAADTDFRGLVVTARQVDSRAEGDSDPFAARLQRTGLRRIPAATVRQDGTFTLPNLRPGIAYLLRVTRQEGNEVLGAALIPADAAAEIPVTLRGVTTIEGRVLNSNGEACRGAEVELTTGLGAQETNDGLLQRRRAAVRFDGSYRFEDVPAGQVNLALVGDPRTGRLYQTQPGIPLTVPFECATLIRIAFALTLPKGATLDPEEQFLVLPADGRRVRQTVQELKASNLVVDLEPGRYTLTRTSTMETKAFEVLPRMIGDLELSFTQ